MQPLPDNTPAWYREGMLHLWLPYAQMQLSLPPLPVSHTQGSRIHLHDGRTLIDGIASWWTACHGYNHPHIIDAVKKQADIMPHVMFGGLVHEQAATLAKRLCAIAPKGLSRVFFADSGSIAVEVALKMALQYWRNLGKVGKDRILCFTNGYHGDTFGAMSVSDPEKSMHKAFRHAVTKQFVLDIPLDEYTLAEFETLVAGVHKELAAFIIEPLVQGAGGMRFHDPDILAELARIARKYDILFIADEIATGFGRTGSMFACNEAGITPDILCLGKALTGGAITLAATLATDEVFNAFLSDDYDAALMHGPTYMGSPLACAAANASLDLFEREPRLKQIERIEAQLSAELEPCRGMKDVVDVRVKGAIGVVQLAPQVDIYALRPAFIEHGAWLRPFKDIVYIAPAFTIVAEELSLLTGAIQAVLANR